MSDVVSLKTPVKIANKIQQTTISELSDQKSNVKVSIEIPTSILEKHNETLIHTPVPNVVA